MAQITDLYLSYDQFCIEKSIHISEDHHQDYFFYSSKYSNNYNTFDVMYELLDCIFHLTRKYHEIQTKFNKFKFKY